MKKKTVTPTVSIPQEIPLSRSPDVNIIKSRMAKANLYLSLLDKRFFSVNDFSANDQSVVASIEAEIHDFVLLRVKSLFGEESTKSSDFSTTEVRALKLLAAALEKKAAVKEEPKTVELPVNINALLVDSSDDEDEWSEDGWDTTEEPPVVTQVVKKAKPKPPIKAKDNVLKRKVTIIDAAGNPKEVESITQKIVAAPPGIRRHPPATFEQQMQMAHNNVNAMQNKISNLNTQSTRSELDE